MDSSIYGPHGYLSFLLLQFRLRLLHFVDKHLSHLLLLALKLHQELLPLGLVGLLQAVGYIQNQY